MFEKYCYIYTSNYCHFENYRKLIGHFICINIHHVTMTCQQKQKQMHATYYINRLHSYYTLTGHLIYFTTKASADHVVNCPSYLRLMRCRPRPLGQYWCIAPLQPHMRTSQYTSGSPLYMSIDWLCTDFSCIHIERAQ